MTSRPRRILPVLAPLLAIALLASFAPAALAYAADAVATAARPHGAGAPAFAEIGLLRERLGRHVARAPVSVAARSPGRCAG